MFIQVSGGLISRLYVLATVVKTDGLGRTIDNTNIRLVWNTQPGMEAKFDDLFQNNFNIEYEPVNLNNRSIKTYGSPAHIILRHMQLNEIQNIGPYNMIWSKDMKDDYIIADWPIHINGRSPCDESMSKFLPTLIPTQEIQDLVNKYVATFPKDGWVYGINIRRGGNTVNYHVEACSRSPDYLFFQKIAHILEHSQNLAKFVITTDSEELLTKLVNTFPNNVIYIKEIEQYPLDCGYSLAGMKRALADWYLLSKTNYIFRTINTGYSLRLCKAFNIPGEELYI